jgi:hypothetical protein
MAAGARPGLFVRKPAIILSFVLAGVMCVFSVLRRA